MDQKKAEILKRRAELLAKPLARSDEAKKMIEVVVFRLSDERYAIESLYIQEVYPIDAVTPLPSAPAFVYGLINVRRKVISIIDLKVFFDLPLQESKGAEKVIILENRRMQVALIADEIEGIKKIEEDSLIPSLPTLTGIRNEFLKGLTKENIIVLDGEKLLESSALLVDEAV